MKRKSPYHSSTKIELANQRNHWYEEARRRDAIIDQQQLRIADLERQLAEQWLPVEDGFWWVVTTGADGPKKYQWDGYLNGIAAEDKNEHIQFPASTHLCRKVGNDAEENSD